MTRAWQRLFPADLASGDTADWLALLAYPAEPHAEPAATPLLEMVAALTSTDASATSIVSLLA